MNDPDPFDEGVPRDGRGRPLIIPCKRDGTPNPKGKAKAYTRASTFARALSDGSGLTSWKVRHAAVGVAISPDLAAMVAAMGSNPDDLTPQAKRDLDAILETAHDRSGGNAKANYGTAVHSLTEPGNAGVVVDPGMAADVEAYGVALDAGKLRAVDSERFVVNDELAVAGTFDHRYEVVDTLEVEHGGRIVELAVGTRLIGDKKTGSLHFDEHAIQLAVYARAKLYDHTTGEREALDVSPQWGVLAHVPKGKATADLYLVDLHAGWKAARLCVDVRAYRSAKSKLAAAFAHGEAERPAEPVEEPAAAPAEPVAQAPEPSPPVDETQAAVELVTRELGAVDLILVEIRQASTRDECVALWQRHAAAGAWRDEHSTAVKARLAELAAVA